MDIRSQVREVKLASPKLAGSDRELRNQALQLVMDALLEKKEEIFAANRADMEQAKKDGVSEPVLKRLKFDE